MDPRPLILFIHHGRVPGGAPTSLRNMAQGIAREGRFRCRVACMYPQMQDFFRAATEIEVCAYPACRNISGRLFMAWCPFTPLRVLLTLLEIISAPPRVLREARAMRREAPALVHLNSAILWPSAIAARLAGLPLVWHVREASAGISLLRGIYSRCIRLLADRVLCIGPLEYRILGGERHASVRLLRNSLDDSFFKPLSITRREARRRFGLRDGDFVFLSLGGGSFRKGAWQLASALRLLPAGFHLLLVGQDVPPPNPVRPPMWKRCLLRCEYWLWQRGWRRYLLWYYRQRLAAALAAVPAGRYTAPGVLADVKPALAAADALVFAGATAHSGRPVYEAWALGVPVVAFDSEVMRMEIEDGADGIIVRRHTPAALAAALQRLRDNPDLSRHLAANGRKKARARCSLADNTRQLAAVYQEVVHAHRLRQ